jgi:hypothetical protein
VVDQEPVAVAGLGGIVDALRENLDAHGAIGPPSLELGASRSPSATS